MSDRPSAVQVYDHGTLVSETDYSYDQAAVTAAPQQPIYGHDTVYSASSPAQPRGNATTITKQCFTSAGSCQNSITTLTYDETGQVIAVKDGRGNTTSFDYTDNYTSDDGAPPSGWYTNTYVFAVSPPRTNGRAHGSTYQYDYEKGELRLAIDENGQQSQYSYYGNNYWNRIMEATLADGGQKSYTYSDAGPNPSVSTSTLMNSGESETSTSMMDGVGHVLYVQTSDPFGPDTAQTTYDGNGRAMTISNPFRGCPAPVNPYPGCTPPSNTTTTYYFDALGRSIETSEQDGSTLQSCYDGVVSSPAVYCSTHLGSLTTGTWADSTDENGNHWQRTSDAFGRLTEVMEPSGSSKSASMETDYTYNMLNDLLSVTQWGGPKYSAGARSRSFTYDSMSRLQTAANPETGTICYGQWSGSNCGGGYDQNGNLLYKTDARGFTTSYTYDPLNRVVSKTFPNDTTGTAISCFQYDTSSIPLSGGYLSGRLTNAWTQATKTACTGSSPYFAPVTGSFLTLRSMAYDTIGRLAAAQQQQCIGSQCSAPTSYSLNMLYDLAGNLKQLTNPVGAAGQSLTLLNYFDTASRPCLTTSSWNDNSPSNLFQTNPSTATPGYAPFGGLLNWYMGSSSSGASTSCSSSPASPMNVTQGYTNRLWVNGISATGQIP
jgi:YD repeat-containing protein